MDSSHAARHDRYIAQFCERHHLPEHQADTMSTRFCEGCESYGEFNHHAPEFRPYWEAQQEAFDLCNQGMTMARERRDLGIDPPLTPLQRVAEARLEWGIAECLAALEVLAE